MSDKSRRLVIVAFVAICILTLAYLLTQGR
jgi:hypothetical protein